MADYTIHLEGLELALRLGIHPHEATPQRVLIGVALTVRYPTAPSADVVDEVLNYDTIRDCIRALEEGTGFALQETLVEAVAAICLADERVVRVIVRSTKPDIYPDARVGCEIVRER